jgi:hypothetical protein
VQNEAMRESAGLAEAFFLSLEMVQDLAAWGRQCHLITPASARRLFETMTKLHAAWLETQA